MILGIDLGTTKSVVGVWKGGVHIIDCNGKLSIPSELTYDNGEIFVGHGSKTRAGGHKIKGFKRHLNDPLTENAPWYSYPQCAAGYVLAKLRLMAERYLGYEVRDAVIAIPSHFDFNQRRATLEAAEIAGLKVKRLLNEATACALAYANRPGHYQFENIMVADIGGGTTDVAYVDAIDGFLSTRYIDGTTLLGGIDFDKALFDDLIGRVKERCGSDDIILTIDQREHLLNLVELAKIELSQCESTSIHLSHFPIGGHLFSGEFVYDKKRFAELCQPLFDKIIAVVKTVLKDRDDKIATTFLALGGASRTSGLKQAIHDQLSLDGKQTMDIETAVAFGAVEFAGMLLGKADALATDILQDNYGIGLENGKYEVLLHKGSTIPFRATKEITIVAGNQTKLSVSIYKGGNSLAKNNTLIGTLEMIGLPPRPAKSLTAVVEFDVDVNMDIRVTAKLKDSPTHEVAITLTSSNGLPEHLMKFMKEKVSTWYAKQRSSPDC